MQFLICSKSPKAIILIVYSFLILYIVLLKSAAKPESKRAMHSQGFSKCRKI